MKRYEKFVLEAEKGIAFEISEGTSEELAIRAIKSNKANAYYKNYENPPIPEGYKHVCGKWNEGFVMERYSDKSQFVWIPVGILDPNGTIDGKSFTEKFGRRNYQNKQFSESEFHETLTSELVLQIESVKKYGGFYISRYDISKNIKTGKPQSVRGEKPWIKIKFNEAKEVATMLETKDNITSHLIFGAEYDSVLEWFIKTEAKTSKEIAIDSTEWGNYWNERKSQIKALETGSCEKWKVNNIYDFTGNVEKWTQEQYNNSYRVVRGGACICKGNKGPAAYRDYYCTDINYIYTGFRVTLYIK